MLSKEKYKKALIEKMHLIQLTPCRPSRITKTLCGAVGNRGFGRLAGIVHLSNGLVQIYIKTQ